MEVESFHADSYPKYSYSGDESNEFPTKYTADGWCMGRMESIPSSTSDS